MKKKDFILIGIILALALLLWGGIELAKKDGAYVVVSLYGEEIAKYSLSVDGEYSLNGGTNVLKIENGEAWMLESNCPTLGSTRCTNQGRISKTLESIICNANGIVVTVYGGEASDIEIVS